MALLFGKDNTGKQVGLGKLDSNIVIWGEN